MGFLSHISSLIPLFLCCAAPAVRIPYRRELDRAEEPQAFLEAKVRDYQQTYLTPYSALTDGESRPVSRTGGAGVVSA